MSLQPAVSNIPAIPATLPGSRGGSINAAERALAGAEHALAQRRDPDMLLSRVAELLREAGWLAGCRFAEVLAQASRLVPQAAVSGGADNALALAREQALNDFRAVLARHNLHEMTCSPTLFAHYSRLGAALPPTAAGAGYLLEDLALAGRPVPPATHQMQPTHRLLHLRAHYERALLPVLRATPVAGSGAGTASTRQAACDMLDACLADLRGADPYDFWRLAVSCSQVLRASSAPSRHTDARRFYARCNLALADCARSNWRPPPALVRSMLALIWRECAWSAAGAHDPAHLELLLDYGLVAPAVAADSSAATAVLWEHGTDLPAWASTPQPREAGSTRELGVLTVNLHAYEDFLQTADASMVALAEHTQAASDAAPVLPSAAFQASVAATRLGNAASALGLGHIGLLADALGLAWRMQAHEAAGATKRRSQLQPGVLVSETRVLGQALEKLHVMLHKVAAGVASPDGGTAFAALVRYLEHVERAE
ncbi:hypothetical protein QS306_10840 [Paraburkholderia bonniea]|uniref:hypothetical protein n=1 Tax=Paraburkholderia bonniea TaxID=2152891 RepID=UPI0012917B20|nr:hypothetical protein [Paraburkholderia bonniea]WJF89600.1 hypothetical protein QS306_10840 [Paraburkholderia bonniea]WJF92914.1 hypothetical protein QS308_10850 [Paraburkholderia bonniea]